MLPLILLLSSSLPLTRAGGGSQLLIAITNLSTSSPITADAPLYNCSTAVLQSLEHLSCSLSQFLAELERLNSSSSSSNDESWSSALMKITWDEAVQVRFGVLVFYDKICFD